MTEPLVGVLDRAFERAAHDGPPALWTLLAVADAVSAGESEETTHDGPAPVSDRRRRLRDLPTDGPVTDEPEAEGERAASSRLLVELGCGAGGWLAQAASSSVVGVDRWPALLKLAHERTGDAVAADPARPPLRAETADAVVSLGNLAARESATDLLATAADVAVPSGVVAVAAPIEPRAVLRGGGSVSVADRTVSWSVAAGRVHDDRATVGIEYEITSRGATSEWVEHPTVRLYDRATLQDAATAAGLDGVGVERDADDWLVVTGRA